MLALQLRAAQETMPPKFGAQLDGAVAGAKSALDELPEIARCIHPAILTTAASVQRYACSPAAHRSRSTSNTDDSRSERDQPRHGCRRGGAP
ncbi:hypothetical protein GCM10009827_115320 [Dactylosporangium maewongense]|uniref:Uncharacterized protein n=1 Tax=Dactylosporangium maewongense TaxID=634393 RepID=A0ABN2DBT2_9ACTN